MDNEVRTTPESTGVTPTEKQRPWSVYVLGVVLLVGITLVGGAFYMHRAEPSAPVPEVPVPKDVDWAKSVRETEEYTEALSLRNAGEYDKAIDTLESLKKEMESLEEQSVIEMDIAGTLFRKDPVAGAARYAEIAADESFPRLTRGTAYLMMYLQYSGTGNIAYIRPFFTQEEYNEFGKNHTLGYESARRMHTLFPFVTAGSVLAKVELREFDPGFPNSTSTPDARLNGEAERIYEKFFALFDSNIAFLERYEGMRQYVPNTYLSHAKFVGELASARYTFTSFDLTTRAIELFDEGLIRARAQGASITEQFIMSKYAEFLFSVGKESEGAQVLKSLGGQILTPMFSDYMSTYRGAREIPRVFAYLAEHSTLAEQFGIKQ